MKIKQSIFLSILSVFVTVTSQTLAQNLPVGTPMIEDAYRDAQLMGKIDSLISFTVRPISPVYATKNKNIFDPSQLLNPQGSYKQEGRLEAWKGNIVIQLLPITLSQQFNSDHPYGWNDGAMIPAKGYQRMFSAGFYAKVGPLSVQLRPEYVYAENTAFQEFYKQRSDQIWYEYSEMYNFIDLPERFGTKPYTRTTWGQSNVSLTFNPIALSLSNENLWWGPGIRNSLLMSNSAAGFKHISLHTVRPINTGIGTFEGQLIGGRLENSGILPPDTTRMYMGHQLYIAKRNEWRYINGLVISYHPKWVPGVFIGMTKSLDFYGSDLGTSLKDILPVLYPMAKKNNHGEELPTIAKDQRSSIFVRWQFLKEHAEVYWEYGREDRGYDSRDVMLQAEYTRAYIFGIQKIFPLLAKKGEYIQFNLEVTQLEQTNTNPEHLWHYWYSDRDIRQGYTNRGQLLGAGIGPGSNLQSISANWIKPSSKIGLQIERYVHNNDLHNIVVKDIRGNWIDLSVALLGEYSYKHFVFTAKFACIKSFNYEDYYRPSYVDPNKFWIPGIDIFNFHGQLSTSYRF
jgi:Capsule assembly protein Wzi